MKIVRVFFTNLGLILGFALLAAPSSQASQLHFGAGGTYSRVTLPGASGGQSSEFSGMGFSLEGRYRLIGDVFSDDFYGLDFFANFGQQTLESTNTGTLKANTRTHLGGGVDFRLGHFFLGMQYQSTSSYVTSATEESTIDYPSYGARFGVQIPLNEDAGYLLTLAVTTELGSAPSTDNAGSRLINQNTGYVGLSVDLLQLF